MSHLSRRSLVASAAVLPALAVPAVAIASVEPDPIFAAIERVKQAAEAHTKAGEEYDAARKRFEEEHGHPRPMAFSKWFREKVGERPDLQLQPFHAPRYDPAPPGQKLLPSPTDRPMPDLSKRRSWMD